MTMGTNMSDLPDSHDLDELLGAYALDAVSPEEADRVEDYLAINPRAAAEVREHREVATKDCGAALSKSLMPRHQRQGPNSPE